MTKHIELKRFNEGTALTTGTLALPALVIEGLAEFKGSFDRLCLQAGTAAIEAMLAADAQQLCGKRYQRHADRQGNRWGMVASEVGWHGGKAATTVIPIVFATGGDPVKLGLVASLNRPDGNVTGISWLSNTMAPKRLELLRELLPQVRTIGFLVNPGNPNIPTEMADVQTAADALGLRLHVGKAGTESEIDAAFVAFVQARVDAVFIAGDPFFLTRRVHLVVLAARHGIPTCSDSRLNAEAGGLMSYGASTIEMYRGVGLYTGRILKGEKPADLPVQQSVKFELVINLRTAKTFGLQVPTKLLATADEVIE